MEVNTIKRKWRRIKIKEGETGRNRKQEVEMVTEKGRGGKKQGKLRKHVPQTYLKRDLLLPRHSEPVQESLHQERYLHLLYRVLLVLILPREISIRRHTNLVPWVLENMYLTLVLPPTPNSARKGRRQEAQPYTPPLGTRA